MRNVSVTGKTGAGPSAMARTVANRGSASRTVGASKSSSSTGGRGFTAARAVMGQNKTTEYNDFKVDYDTTYFIAFLEEVNYGTIRRHWINKSPRNCPNTDGKHPELCPICEIGHVPNVAALFNVVDLEEPTKVLKWEASPSVFDKIVDLATELHEVPEDRGGPLELNSPGVYAKVSKKKTGNGPRGFTEYSITRIKERDLIEDHNLKGIDESAYEALSEKMNTEDGIKYNTYDELQEWLDKQDV